MAAPGSIGGGLRRTPRPGAMAVPLDPPPGRRMLA